MRDLFLAALLCLAILILPAFSHAQVGEDGADTTAGAQVDWSDLSGLLGMPVISADGDEVGVLQDVVLTEEEPAQAVIKTDGLLGLAEREAAVPWSEIRPGPAAVTLTQTTRPQIVDRPAPAADAVRLTAVLEQD